MKSNVRVKADLDPLGALGDLGVQQAGRSAGQAQAHARRRGQQAERVLTLPSAHPHLGWYCVRAILWAFTYEAPISVTAHAGAVFNESGVPLHIGATLLFPGGRRGHFECGKHGPHWLRMHAASPRAHACLHSPPAPCLLRPATLQGLTRH